MNVLSARVVEFRKKKGLTQEQLAKELNVSRGILSLVEAGDRTPSKEMAKRLSKYFKVPVDTFLFEEYVPQPPAQKMMLTPAMVTLLEVVDEYAAKRNIKITPAQKATMVNIMLEKNEKDPDKTQKEIDGLVEILLRLQQAQSL